MRPKDSLHGVILLTVLDLFVQTVTVSLPAVVSKSKSIDQGDMLGVPGMVRDVCFKSPVQQHVAFETEWADQSWRHRECGWWLHFWVYGLPNAHLLRTIGLL